MGSGCPPWPIALTIAVLAVAVYGLLIFSGHVDWRRGIRIIVGCFILFGAPTIAMGIMASADIGGGASDARVHERADYDPAPRQGGAICWTCGIAPSAPTGN